MEIKQFDRKKAEEEEKQIEQTRLDLAYYRGYSDAIEKVLKLLIRESDE
jgi:hypothetical protein